MSEHPRPATERAFLARLLRENPHVGDDLAVLRPPAGMLLAGIDPALDGVHFELSACGHHAAGRKAANRNLSDVAAMGGTPTGLLLSLVVPRGTSADDADAAYDGVVSAARDAGCDVVGGDFAVWQGPLAVVVAVLGVAAKPVPRGPVKVGQRLFVTGPLGGSILGRHLTFKPRLDEGRALASQAGMIGLTAMLDLSDGLSRDVRRLLGPHGVTLGDVPIHRDADLLARTSGDAPLHHALHDGEDYELLFAADVAPAGVTAVEVGVVTPEPGVRLDDGSDVPDLGFDHAA